MTRRRSVTLLTTVLERNALSPPSARVDQHLGSRPTPRPAQGDFPAAAARKLGIVAVPLICDPGTTDRGRDAAGGP